MSPRIKRLIHVGCTAASKYPEKPTYIMVRGKKTGVRDILWMKKRQGMEPPFQTIHVYRVELEDGREVELEYHEKKMEWYLVESVM